MTGGESQTSEAVFNLLLDPFGYLRMAGAPALGHGPYCLPGQGWSSTGEDRSQILGDLCTMTPSNESLQVAAKVDLTALPAGPLKVPFDGTPQPPMIVTGHELHPA